MAGRVRSRKAVGFRPREPTEVGGRHVTEPTGPARDSSLRDRKAPGVCIQRTPQPRFDNVSASCAARYLPDPDILAAALIEAARHVFDTLGRGIERGRDSELHRLRALARR